MVKVPGRNWPVSSRRNGDGAAARLTDPRFGTLGALASALGDPPDLDVLSFAEDDAASLRVVFSASYLALSPPARRLFRRLSLLPPRAAFSVAEAIAVLGDAPDVTERRIRQSLDRLAGVHLLERESADTYTLHDLLHAYAAEWRAAEDPYPGRGSGLAPRCDAAYGA